MLRVQGDYAAAAAAYEEAAALGRDPQPGLALLTLARGRVPAAVAMVRRLMDETPDPVHRSGHLPAAVEVLLAAGRVDAARLAADELTSVAASFGCEASRRRVHSGRGRWSLAAGDA